MKRDDGIGIVELLVGTLIVTVVIAVAGPQLKQLVDRSREAAAQRDAAVKAANDVINGTEAAAKNPPMWCWRCSKKVSGPDEQGRCPECQGNLANQQQLEKAGVTKQQWEKGQEDARRQAQERQREAPPEPPASSGGSSSPGSTMEHTQPDTTTTEETSHDHSGTDDGSTDSSSSDSGSDSGGD